jgi:hypothetical protein
MSAEDEEEESEEGSEDGFGEEAEEEEEAGSSVAEELDVVHTDEELAYSRDHHHEQVTPPVKKAAVGFFRKRPLRPQADFGPWTSADSGTSEIQEALEGMDVNAEPVADTVDTESEIEELVWNRET